MHFSEIIELQFRKNRIHCFIFFFNESNSSISVNESNSSFSVTSVTALSQSLVDLCITNTPDKIVRSGVMPLGISDHSLVYLIRKTHYTIPGCIKIISTRSFKNFQSGGVPSGP